MIFGTFLGFVGYGGIQTALNHGFLIELPYFKELSTLNFFLQTRRATLKHPQFNPRTIAGKTWFFVVIKVAVQELL